jgi:hypothetical protein
MRKIIRLTESDLTRLVNKVLNEQEIGGFKEPQSKEGRGVEFDYWNKLIVPQLTQQGFKLVDESKATTYKKCPYACCKYMYFNNHSTGVNLFLDCGDDPSRNPWLLKVYYQGNKAVKSFNVAPNSQKASQDAIRYALQLKNKLYPANTVAQPQSNGITESDIKRLVNKVIKEQSQINEIDLSNISSKIKSFSNDPLLQKILNAMMKVASYAPAKALDGIRAIWKATFGRPEYGGPVTNAERAEIAQLLNPFVTLTQDEITDFLKRKVEIGKKLNSILN